MGENCNYFYQADNLKIFAFTQIQRDNYTTKPNQNMHADVLFATKL